MVSDSIEESSLVRSVDDVVVGLNFMTECFSDSGLTDTRRSRQQQIRDLSVRYKVLEYSFSLLGQNTIFNGLGSILLNPKKVITHNYKGVGLPHRVALGISDSKISFASC
jgi:hypothetical protein